MDNLPDEMNDTLRLLRESIRRFVEKEIVPQGHAWEEQGFVPREILRDMGKLGFLGLRYPEEYGGGALDARATALLAEELGRSTFSGFAITVLVHTDMASPHLVNAGSPAHWRFLLARHGRGINVCFADGSARWVPLEETYRMKWSYNWTGYGLTLPSR